MIDLHEYELAAQPWVDRLGWTLVHSVWQLAAVGVLFALLTAALRRRSPRARYAAAGATLVAIAVCPVVTWLTLPAWQSVRPAETTVGSTVPNEESPETPFTSTRHVARVRRHVPAVAVSEPLTDPLEWTPLPNSATTGTAIETSAAQPESISSRSWTARADDVLRPALPWLVGIWTLGILFLSAWHVGGWIMIGQLKRRAVELADDRVLQLVARLKLRLVVTRPVLLLESALVRVPTTFGWLRPAVLLPASLATGLPADQLQAILAGELAHIRRHDYLVNLLQAVAETLLFYHPVVWWVSHRIRVEREYCTDEAAVAACADRFAYAKALAALEEHCGRQPALTLAASGGDLRSRILHILRQPPADGRSWGIRSAGAFVCVGFLAVFILAGSLRRGSAESESEGGVAAEGPPTGSRPAVPPLEKDNTPEVLQNRSDDGQAAQKTSAENQDETVPSRAWHILRQIDALGHLLGLPQRLVAVSAPERRKGLAWEGIEPGGQVELDLRVEGDVTGEIVVGFFEDARWWVAEPVQARAFPKAGEYTIKNLTPGTYHVGAMVGSALKPLALGVHAEWPQPIEIKSGEAATVHVLVSEKFKSNPAGQGYLKGFAAEWGKLDPRRLITVRTLDEQGQPAPFCRITLVERGKYVFFHNFGTDAEGFGFYDQHDGRFSLLAQRFDVDPETMTERYQFRRLAELYESSERPRINVRFGPYPTGNGKTIGRVHDQHGQPLKEFFISLESDDGRSKYDWFTGEPAEYAEQSTWWLRRPIIDEDGRYEISGLAPGRYRVNVRHFDAYAYVDFVGTPQDQWPTVTVSDDAQGPVRLDIEVEAKQLLYGRAVYEDGQPVKKGAWVAWLRRDSRDPWQGDAFSVSLEANGRFRVGLSQDERRKLIKNSQGRIDVQSFDASPDKPQTIKVPIYKLPEDPAQPYEVVFKRENAPATTPTESTKSTKPEEESTSAPDETQHAQQPKLPEAVERGVAFLRKVQRADGSFDWNGDIFRGGVSALCTLALLRSGVQDSDPQIEQALAYLHKAELTRTYEVALQALAFCAAADPKKDLALIQRNVDWLEAAQSKGPRSRGGWEYTGGERIINASDNSNSEFAIWALDEAAEAGAKVKPETWEAAREYWRKGQREDGSWSYIPDAQEPNGTGSMTCAGLASLAACLEWLPKEDVTPEDLAALDRGLVWLRDHFAVNKNPGHRSWILYYLLTLRRVGEVTGVRRIGDHDWFREGFNFLIERQQPETGVSTGPKGLETEPVIGTALALLFIQQGPGPQLRGDATRRRGKSGTVVDEQQRPLEDATVHVEWRLGGQSHTSWAKTDEHGRFTFAYPPKYIEFKWLLVSTRRSAGGEQYRPAVIQGEPLVLQVPRIGHGIQGIWNPVSFEEKGQNATQEEIRSRQMFLTADTISVWKGGEQISQEKYVFDTSKAPAQIDLTDKATLGLFELIDDRLTICLNRPGGERPTKLASEPNSPNATLIVLERVDAAAEIERIENADAPAPGNRLYAAVLVETTHAGFSDAPLKDCIEFLSKLHEMPMEIDKEALRQAGVSVETPIDFHVRGVGLHTALVMMLRPLRLSYEVRDGRIVVTGAGR